MTIQIYAEFRPTQFDSKGLGLSGQQDWLVAPVSQTRDSDVLAQSNFEVAKRILDDAAVEYETHRFGHWGPGWFEIILCEPTDKARSELESMQAELEDYPVLDEMDLSEREYEAAQEAWGHMSYRDRIELCARCGVPILAARRDYPPSDDQGQIRDYLLGY